MSVGRYFELSMYDDIRPDRGGSKPRATADFRCPLCHQGPFPRNSPMGRQFGLLDGCTHAFCLFCIREYRRNLLMTSRNCQGFEPGPAPCPACQVPFRYIMASARWIRDTEEKGRFVASYLASVDGLACCFLRRGMGSGLCDNSCQQVGDRARDAAKKCYARRVKSCV